MDSVQSGLSERRRSLERNAVTTRDIHSQFRKPQDSHIPLGGVEKTSYQRH